jgi:hypothetical protein
MSETRIHLSAVFMAAVELRCKRMRSCAWLNVILPSPAKYKKQCNSIMLRQMVVNAVFESTLIKNNSIVKENIRIF